MRHKILVAMLANQRIHAGIVDVIGDEHDRAGADLGVERACSICKDQSFDAAILIWSCTGRMTAGLPLS